MNCCTRALNLCPDICVSESMDMSTNALRILTCFLCIFYFTINHHTYLWFLTYLVTWDPLVNICLTYIYILLYYVALGNYNCSFISSAVSMASVVSLCLMLLHGWHTRMFQLGTVIYAGIQRTGLNKWFRRLANGYILKTKHYCCRVCENIPIVLCGTRLTWRIGR